MSASTFRNMSASSWVNKSAHGYVSLSAFCNGKMSDLFSDQYYQPVDTHWEAGPSGKDVEEIPSVRIVDFIFTRTLSHVVTLYVCICPFSQHGGTYFKYAQIRGALAGPHRHLLRCVSTARWAYLSNCYVSTTVYGAGIGAQMKQEHT